MTFTLPKLIDHAGARVLTSAQLAEAYGTTVKEISKNFRRNKERYVDCKHYFLLEGDVLDEFKNYSPNCRLVAKGTHHLYLWTERGALLHAKSLNTEQAWLVYDFLVENYFRTKAAAQAAPQTAQKPAPPSMTSEQAKAMLAYRKLQLITAIKEADLACAKTDEAEFLMQHPELTVYLKTLPNGSTC